MRIIQSVILSIALSIGATYLLRRLLVAAEGRPGGPPGEGGNVAVTVAVVPVVVGNTWTIGGPALPWKLMAKKFGRRRLK